MDIAKAMISLRSMNSVLKLCALLLLTFLLLPSVATASGNNSNAALTSVAATSQTSNYAVLGKLHYPSSIREMAYVPFDNEIFASHTGASKGVYVLFTV